MFRVWAPTARHVEVVLAQELGWQLLPGGVHRLERAPDGTFATRVSGVGPGVLYWYRLDDDRLLPDPASRFQPHGVHGPSQVIDPDAFEWHDDGWHGLEEQALVVYELHVGTFSAEGTFAGVERRLDDLAALGITALELMPLAQCPGRWNWGYDGVDLFAPSHVYGTPEDLRRLVEAAHRRGLGIILDVVYNHLGPDGAYLSAFSPYYFTDRHKSPWGAGVNLDGPHSEHVRRFFIENALHWVHEYHIDGLRLDATHALQDDGNRHFLAELAQRVRDDAGDRRVVLIAEDERNLDRLVRQTGDGGFGLDGVWSDDFHHHTRRLLAGDSEGYYESFSGSCEDLATTVRRGWFFTGQVARHTGEPRGSDPWNIPLQRFVFCLQNHDQVGNRALGERLHHQTDLAAYRAASALLLTLPETPLLFMGQEWAASSPFLYFTDHEAELGHKVTEGRRAEFSAFSAFADPATRDRIPDPQARETVERSRLQWSERQRMPHLGVLRLYQTLLRLRHEERALLEPLVSEGARAERAGLHVAEHARHLPARALDDSTLAVCRAADGAEVWVIARLRGEGLVKVAELRGAADWSVVMTTEDAAFAENGRVPRLEVCAGSPAVRFDGPAAIILRRPAAQS